MPHAVTATDAERMDRHYRFQRFIYDSTRTHYLIGRRHLIEGLAPGPGASVLEIGCGTAWNLIRCAKRYPEARLFGLDVSRAMLETAGTSIKRHGLEQRVALRQGDATNFDGGALFGQQTFDRVFFSYALSMIPGWIAALDCAAAHVAPGGALHIVDFGQCEQLPRAFKAALFAFLDHYTVTPRADLESRIATTARAHRLASNFSRLHRGYTDYAVLRRER